MAIPELAPAGPGPGPGSGPGAPRRGGPLPGPLESTATRYKYRGCRRDIAASGECSKSTSLRLAAGTRAPIFHSSSLVPRGFKACMVGLHCPRLPGTPRSQVAVPTRRPTPSDSLTLSTLLDWAQEHRMRSSARQWSPCFGTVLRTLWSEKEDCCCVSLVNCWVCCTTLAAMPAMAAMHCYEKSAPRTEDRLPHLRQAPIRT